MREEEESRMQPRMNCRPPPALLRSSDSLASVGGSGRSLIAGRQVHPWLHIALFLSRMAHPPRRLTELLPDPISLRSTACARICKYEKKNGRSEIKV
ncbi:hypothetical protein EJB05_57667 [Eragrostis curvula]|uniref:Uncharacterized protein n=1 Tax=Eragrostis curvula TaxID=38414 RepID=A0A5J9SEB1_9POAL|nr:hypothetical protein EJB05_57667 [Eragrostis curvula]